MKPQNTVMIAVVMAATLALLIQDVAMAEIQKAERYRANQITAESIVIAPFNTEWAVVGKVEANSTTAAARFSDNMTTGRQTRKPAQQPLGRHTLREIGSIDERVYEAVLGGKSVWTDRRLIAVALGGKSVWTD
jgi:hypothetical protein